MKKQHILLITALVLVLFLLSPLFGRIVGAVPLSEEAVEALREEYPAVDPFNPLVCFEGPLTFSREAQAADTLLYCEVLAAKQTTWYTIYTVRVLDTSRGGIRSGARVELVERLGANPQYFDVGERLVAAVWRVESEENRWETYPFNMFRVTEDGYVVSLFYENSYYANYDRKTHSGWTVQALLRKYIAWDGVPAVTDLPWEEQQAWLGQWGYLPPGE